MATTYKYPYKKKDAAIGRAIKVVNKLKECYTKNIDANLLSVYQSGNEVSLIMTVFSKSGDITPITLELIQIVECKEK